MLHRPRSLPTGLACALSCLVAAAGAGAPHAEAPPEAAAGTAPLPLTPRGSLEPDVAAVPPEPPPPLPAAADVPRYHVLRAIDCQCRAVLYSSIGNLLARERGRLAGSRGLCEMSCMQVLLPRQCEQSGIHLKIAILYFSELEARNRTGGYALDLYYRLAEAEAKADLLDKAAADLAAAVGQGRDLTRQGFKLPVELMTLQRQEIDARADRVKLGAGIVELNGRLKALIHQKDLPAGDRLWPAGEFDVAFPPLDPDAAVEVALAHRPELNLLRTVLRDLDGKTLPVVRDFLKGLNALLAEQAKHSTAAGRAYDSVKDVLTAHAVERALRSAQVQQLLAERERAVAAEVRQAVADLHAKGQLVVLDRERVLAAAVKQREADEKAKSGGGSFLEVLNANLEAYKARGQLVEDVMGWHAAGAKLRQAQGLLVRECHGPVAE
jgi:hypothetical protein